MNRVQFGDCRDTMRAWAAAGIKAQTCVTSPPYFGLRDYGHDGQIGLEATPEAFVAALVEVFRCVRDVLADDGTLWLNIGDSYAGYHGNKNAAYDAAPSNKGGYFENQRKTLVNHNGIKNKDLIGIPWMLAFALRADGWYLRQDIIWSKPNPMPESVTDRCTKSHEYIFLLSKSDRYFYDHEAVKEPASPSSIARWDQDIENQIGSDRVPGKTNGNMKAVGGKLRKQNSTNDSFVPGATVHSGLHREGSEREPETRNKRSVWTVATVPYKGAHFATFPPALIEPCILAGSRPGDVVLDPFFGSGTTGMVAQNLGRRWLGCELNPAYGPLQDERLAQQGLEFA
jgi:DNA modification methylase